MCWKHTVVPEKEGRALEGMDRLAAANRIVSGDEQLGYRAISRTTFRIYGLEQLVGRLAGAADPIYVVQDQHRDRQTLHSHDHAARRPRVRSDLRQRHDRLCGGAMGPALDHLRFLARISTLARQRLMNAVFDYYKLAQTGRRRRQRLRLRDRAPYHLDDHRKRRAAES